MGEQGGDSCVLSRRLTTRWAAAGILTDGLLLRARALTVVATCQSHQTFLPLRRPCCPCRRSVTGESPDSFAAQVPYPSIPTGTHPLPLGSAAGWLTSS